MKDEVQIFKNTNEIHLLTIIFTFNFFFFSRLCIRLCVLGNMNSLNYFLNLCLLVKSCTGYVIKKLICHFIYLPVMKACRCRVLCYHWLILSFNVVQFIFGYSIININKKGTSIKYSICKFGLSDPTLLQRE